MEGQEEKKAGQVPEDPTQIGMSAAGGMPGAQWGDVKEKQLTKEEMLERQRLSFMI